MAGAGRRQSSISLPGLLDGNSLNPGTLQEQRAIVVVIHRGCCGSARAPRGDVRPSVEGGVVGRRLERTAKSANTLLRDNDRLVAVEVGADLLRCPWSHEARRAGDEHTEQPSKDDC